MRILFTALSSDLAGGQKVCLQTMSAAAAAGHTPLLVLPGPGPVATEAAGQGFAVHYLAFPRSYHLGAAWKFARLLRRERVSLVHCHDAVRGAILGFLGARLAGVPFLLHVHLANHFNERAPIRAAQRALYRATAARSRRLIAVSESVRQDLLSIGVSAARILTIPNGVDTDPAPSAFTRKEARLALGVDGASLVVGSVARLCRTKGQADLLRAFAALPAPGETVLVLVGDDLERAGAYRQELEALAAQLRVETRVRFLGFRRDAARLVHGFDVFALPSYAEGMPLALLEAMAAGRPVVATDVGGVSEVVLTRPDEATGLLIAPGDVRALTSALQRLLASTDLREHLGTRGRTRVEQRFSVDTMTRDVLRAYAWP